MSAATPTRTLLGLKQPGQPSRLVVWDTEQIRVGRSSENDIVVEDEEASRDHALFTRGTADYFVEDLRTANGTALNGTPISEKATLGTKDVIVVGPLEITFIRTQKDPSSLGLEVIYSSQLKGFGGNSANQNPDATTLGLDDMGPAGEFEVGAVNAFGEDPTAADVNEIVRQDKQEQESVSQPRNLDLELGDMFITESPKSEAPANASAAAGALSLHLELEGLTPELAGQLQALFGKVIALPAMRIRIKGDDIA
jgi:pSer/pThr/pTyr-binding forkhead associated (FHA) protein